MMLHCVYPCDVLYTTPQNSRNHYNVDFSIYDHHAIDTIIEINNLKIKKEIGITTKSKETSSKLAISS